MNKTEELVMKCFCSKTFLDYKTPGYKRFLASAARRFVKLENIHKTKERHEKFLRWCRRHPNINEKGVKLPKHWGQFKVDGKWI